MLYTSTCSSLYCCENKKVKINCSQLKTEHLLNQTFSPDKAWNKSHQNFSTMLFASTMLRNLVYYLSACLLYRHQEAVAQRCSVKKVFLEISQNSQENTCNFNNKETLTQVFSCEFCEIYKNTFCYRIPPLAVSAHPIVYTKCLEFTV